MPHRAILSAALLALAAASTARAQCGLIISEYIEGTSNNKAIELYNGTGASIDLLAGNYVVQLYINGNSAPGASASLTGTVAAGATYVIANSSASPAVATNAQQLSGSITFTGDDAVVLRSGGASGTIIDSIGQVGFDPGTEWGTGLTSTADNTLRRKAVITTGDAIATNVFDPSIEWDGYATDTFSGLGSHTMNCGATNTPPALDTIGNKSATNGGVLVFTVTAQDLTDNDVITLSASSLPAGAVFDPATNATAVTNTFTWNPVGAVGVYTTSFHAADNDGTTTQTITITVFPAPATNLPPVMAPFAPQSVVVGANLGFQVTATDVIDNDSITLSASNLPVGAVFAPVTNFTGVTNSFVWNAASPVGVYTVQFYAVDNDGFTNVATTITVQNVAVELGASNVWINEINYDTPGADSNEYVEVAGVAGTDLTGYSIVLYNGGDGDPYLTTNLPATVITNESCNRGTVVVLTPVFQNGAPDGVALVRGSDVIQFLSYEGAMTASSGPAAGLTTSANMGTQNSTNPTLQLSGIATGYAGYAWTTNTASPGALNVAQYVDGCSAPPLTIQFSPATASAAEYAGTVDVLVYKSDLFSNVTAELVLGGTATQGVDYTLSTTNISLSGATTSQVVTITLVDDFVFESNETVVLAFTNLVAATPGVPATHTLTITDDDQLALSITTAAQVVQSGVTAMDIGGAANSVIVGELAWSNQLTGAAGTIPVLPDWVIPGVALGVGGNTIVVRGTNAYGSSAQASRTITRLAEPWAGTETLLVQDFETTDTWSIVSGAALVSTNAGAADFPDGQRIFNGVQSWQVNNASVTLELAQASIAGYTGRQVNIRLSSTAYNNVQGADLSDRIRIFVALDGAAFTTNAALDLNGNNNARWGFWATNRAAIPADATAAFGAPQSGQSTNNFSDLYVLLPDAATSVAVRVHALNDNTNEFWNVDAVRVTGYSGGPNPDADGDGLPDAWEVEHFGGTTNAAAGDVDDDGYSNLDEFIAMTQPTNAQAYLELTGVTNAPTAGVHFHGATGRLYMVDYSDNLLNAAGWVEFTNNIAGTNGLMRIPDAGVTNSRGYRLRVRLQ